MFYHRYHFKPKLWPTLAVLILFPILLSLGFWQLGRMHEKQAILDAKALGQDAVLVFTPDSAPAAYSQMQVSGTLLQKFSIFLEHQMHNSQPGYHILTPLAIDADLPWIWVNRGWVAKDYKGAKEDLRVTLSGIVYYPSGKRFILGENFLSTPDSLRIQYIDIPALTTHFSHLFYPYVLLLNPDAPAGFIRDWQIKTLPPGKHLGYAVQWFALALTLAILYMGTQIRRIHHDK